MSLDLSLKNVLTYSTASMPNSRFAVLGKSKLSSLPARSVRWRDHSASEILNSGGLAGAASAAGTAWAVPQASGAAAVGFLPVAAYLPTRRYIRPEH